MKEEVLKGNNLVLLIFSFWKWRQKHSKNVLSNETINHFEKFPLGNNFRLVF